MIPNLMSIDSAEPTSTERYSLAVVAIFCVCCGLIFLFGLVGNSTTFLVIVRSRFLHTKTNFYLCSLAISDLILLLFGLPFDVAYVINARQAIAKDWFCIGRGLVSETATNASILTIVAFTIERYVAICRPFCLWGNRSRKYRTALHIAIIWVVSLLAAMPLAVQYGVLTYHACACSEGGNENGNESSLSGSYGNIPFDITISDSLEEFDDLMSQQGINDSALVTIDEYSFESECLRQCMKVPPMSMCYTLDERKIPYSFELSSILFFVLPMLLIAACYGLIMCELKRSIEAMGTSRTSQSSETSKKAELLFGVRRSVRQQAQARGLVIRMLLVVVIGFFMCFLPLHAQRLLSISAQAHETFTNAEFLRIWYLISGFLYYLRKFRIAFYGHLLRCYHWNRRRLQSLDFKMTSEDKNRRTPQCCHLEEGINRSGNTGQKDSAKSQPVFSLNHQSNQNKTELNRFSPVLLATPDHSDMSRPNIIFSSNHNSGTSPLVSFRKVGPSSGPSVVHMVQIHDTPKTVTTTQAQLLSNGAASKEKINAKAKPTAKKKKSISETLFERAVLYLGLKLFSNGKSRPASV